MVKDIKLQISLFQHYKIPTLGYHYTVSMILLTLCNGEVGIL